MTKPELNAFVDSMREFHKDALQMLKEDKQKEQAEEKSRFSTIMPGEFPLPCDPLPLFIVPGQELQVVRSQKNGPSNFTTILKQR